MNKTYNGPQSRLMDTLMEKTEQHGPIDTVNQVYLARGCLSIEKEYSILKWTREVPTEIGWYIVWTPGDSCRGLVEFVNDLDGICVLTQYGDWLQNIEELEGCTDWWYGPIPQIIEKGVENE